MTSVTGRIEGLAVAYVDDFMVAIHDGQRQRMGIRIFYPMWSTDHATSASESLGCCLVRTTRNQWFYWICHQQDENSVMIL